MEWQVSAACGPGGSWLRRADEDGPVVGLRRADGLRGSAAGGAQRIVDAGTISRVHGKHCGGARTGTDGQDVASAARYCRCGIRDGLRDARVDELAARDGLLR